MTETAVTSEDALHRAEAAGTRVQELRAQMRAEVELRNLAIVDAYEAGVPLRTIARRAGIGETTAHDIIAAN